VIRFVLSALLIAAAFSAEAQSGRVRIASGGASQIVSVPVNQAVVLESDRSFAEVRIAGPAIFDVQPLTDRSVYVLGVARGRSSLSLVDASGGVVASAVVLVQPDISELKQRMAELLPRAPIEIRPIGEGVVLSGVVSDAATVTRAAELAEAFIGGDDAENRVTNLLTVGSTQQVSLQVRIAEVNREAAKDIGISLSGSRSGDPSGNLVTGGSAFSPVPTFGTLDALFSLGDSVMLNVSIEALETKGFARILAEPNLVALSGGEAQFLAGGEVPIPLISADGDVSVEYRDVGVSLNFRPVVLADDAISIAVSAEVAAVDPSLGVSLPQTELPGFTVRRATTVVELRDGQSFAIAGLYQDDFMDEVSQVPWLGEAPVVGALFRSAEFSRGETELIIVVSASLVAPVAAGVRIPDPTDAVRAPTESELFLFGRTAAAAEGPRFDGPVGYAYE
jgi:pilus assembly protein CpaC